MKTEIRTARKPRICYVCKSKISIGDKYKYGICRDINLGKYVAVAYCIKHDVETDQLTKNILANAGKITKNITAAQKEINDIIEDAMHMLSPNKAFYLTVHVIKSAAQKAMDAANETIEKYITQTENIGRIFGETEKVAYYREQANKLEYWVELLEELDNACNNILHHTEMHKRLAQPEIQNIKKAAEKVVEFYI